MTRSSASKAALDALKVRTSDQAVRVFGTLRTIAPRTAITESAPGARSTADPKTGVRTSEPTAVMKVGKDPAWFFYADRGPHQGFEHPGQIALVSKRTGKVTLSRTTNWVPLVGGRLPEFFASADGYEGKRFVVFDRPWPGEFATAATAGVPVADTAAQQRAAAVLAAQHACVLRFSDSLGDFFDFGRVDQTRAQLGRFFQRLGQLDGGFIQERYLPKLGRTPVAEAQRLITANSCKDLTIYAAGAAQRNGEAGVMIGLRAAKGKVKWQTLDATSLKALLRKNPGVSFKLIFDAPYTGRLAQALHGEPNVSVLLASGGPTDASFAFLPALTGPQGVVLNPSNPRHLLEFSNALIDGLTLFEAAPAEVDHAIAQNSTSFMGWMLARALNLAGSPFGGHLISPVEILPGTTAPPVNTTPPTTVVGASPKVNHAPVGQTDPQRTNEDTAVDFTLGGSDADGDALTYTVTAQPAHGSLTATGPFVTYTPDKDFAGVDTIAYRVSDATESSLPVTVQITVDPVDDASVLTLSAGKTTYTEQDAPVAVDPALQLADVDSPTLDGATVALAAGDDELDFTSANGITGDFDAGVLTLTGTASVADYQAALRSVTFATPGDAPSTAPRSIRFTVGTTSATRDLEVVAVDDLPVLATTAAKAASYTEDGTSAPLDLDITLTDPDDTTLPGAKVTIGTGHEAADRLDFSDQNGIAGAFDTTTGVLTLSGSAPLADYQTALRSIRFRTVSENPSETTRVIALQAGGGAPLSRDLTVARHNDAPTLTTSAGSATFTENGAPVPVDANVAIGDVDSAQLSGASVTFDNVAGDVLAFTPAGAITGSYASGTLTLSGSGTPAEYQQVLRSITFSTPGDDPTSGRTFTYAVTDAGGATSAAATRALAITAVNDAPALSTTDTGSVSFTENGAAVAIQPNLELSDPDSAALTGATVSIVSGRGSTDSLSFSDQNGITGAWNGTTLTLEGTASKADYRTALRSVNFSAAGENPAGGPRGVRIVVTDGTDASAPLDRTVTVQPVNDPPVVTTTAGATGWTEGDAPLTIDGALTVTDVDSAQLASATVELSNAVAGDTLSFTPAGAVTGSYSNHALTLTGTDTVATYQAVLRSVKFTNSTTTPGRSTRQVSFLVNDGSASSAAATRDIAVTDVNTKPVVDTSAGSATFVEAAAAVAVDPGVTVADDDSASLASARAQLTTNFDPAHDTLSYTAPAGNPVTATAFNALDGTLALSGGATPAQYAAALRAVKFSSDDDNPSGALHTVAFTVDDGSTVNHASAPDTRDVSITPSNDAPRLATSPDSTQYLERGAAVQGDSLLTLTDPDSPALTGATATIKTGKQTGDALSFDAPPAGITGVVNAAADTVTFTGSASPAAYQTALRGVRFESSNHHPDAARTLAFTATDGALTSAEATKALTIKSVNDAPVLTTSGGATSFAEDGGAVIIDGDLTVSDSDDSTLQSASVRITGNLHASEDTLTFSDTANIHGSYDTGLLTLTGPDTLANYQAALRSVRYGNGSQNPDTGDRTIAFAVSDGTDASAPQTKTVTVSATDDAPVITTTSGSASFTEDGAAVTVDSGLTVADVDTTSLTGAVVKLTSSQSTADDRLQFTAAGPITGGYDAASGTLTLTGTDTLANYRDALRSVQFTSTSQNPTADRTVTFTVSDGTLTSSAASRTVKVTPVNDAPVLTQTDAALTFTEGDAATAIAPNLGTSDADDTQLESATVKITDHYHAGQDVLSFATQNGISGTVSGDTLTLTGGATLTQYRDALRSVKYANSSENPSAETRTVTFTVNDGDDTSAAATRDITVAPVNDAPKAANLTVSAVGNTTQVVETFGPDAVAAPDPAGPNTTDKRDILGQATDVDDDVSTLRAVATTVTTVGGGSAIVRADGGFTYLPAAGCAADQFTYTVVDPHGATSTGTISITKQGCYWYVDAAAAAGGIGTSAAPFKTLSPVSGGGDADSAGQTLFVSAGTYTGGLTLETGQKLFGPRHGLAVPSGFTSTSGSTLINPSSGSASIGNGLVLGTDATVSGLDLGTATGAALSGTSVGTATIDDVSIDNATGGAVSISGGATVLAVHLTSVKGTALALSNASGTFAADSGAVTSVNISGGSVSSTFGTAVNGGPIALSANTGTTRFNGGVALSAGASDAFKATGGGTVVVTGAANTITTTTGTALNVTDTTIGASGLTFRRIDANGATRGIVLSHTGSAGGLTVTGNAGQCNLASQAGCSGGVIAGATGADDTGSTPGGTGIVLNDTQAPSFSHMYLHDASNYAIRGSAVRGFTFDSGVIAGNNGNAVGGPAPEGSITFTDLTGSAAITNSAIAGGSDGNIRVTNSAGTLDRLKVEDATIGAVRDPAGDDAINVATVLSTPSTMNVTVNRTTLTAAPGDLFQATLDGNGGGDAVFTNNTLSNTSPASGSGGVTLEGARGGATTFNVTGNTMRDARGTAFLLIHGRGTANLTATVASNKIGATGVANSGSLEGRGMDIEHNGGGGTMTVALTGNEIRQYNGDAIHLQAGAGAQETGTFNVTASGNTIAEPGTTAAADDPSWGLMLNNGVTPSDAFSTCLKLGPNTLTGSGRNGGNDYRLRQRMNTAVRLPGYTGAPSDLTAINTYVAAALGGSPAGSVTVDSSGFTGGGTTCP